MYTSTSHAPFPQSPLPELASNAEWLTAIHRGGAELDPQPFQLKLLSLPMATQFSTAQSRDVTKGDQVLNKGFDVRLEDSRTQILIELNSNPY